MQHDVLNPARTVESTLTIHSFTVQAIKRHDNARQTGFALDAIRRTSRYIDDIPVNHNTGGTAPGRPRDGQ